MPVRLHRSNPPGVDVLHVVNATGRIPDHIHWSWCVVGVERGERVVSSGGTQIRLQPGEAALIPPGRVHCCHSPDGGCDFWAVSIDPESPSHPDSGSSAPAGVRRVPAVQTFRKLVSETHRAEESVLKHLLSFLIAPDDDSEKQPPAASPPVQVARGLLESPEGTELSLDDLARKAGASPSHLARRFSRETGVAPNEYRTLVRLRQARALLAAGSSLADTAMACGFYDQSHLSLRFRKYMGMTPGQYARAAR